MINSSEMAARLSSIVDGNGGREVVAKVTGIPLPSVDRYCRGNTVPPADRLGLIAHACHVTADFIIFGRVDASQMTMHQEISSDLLDVAMIPKLDVIASAGPGIENPYPYELDRLPFPRQWLDWLGVPEESARFLDSRGDSMWPTISEGAICLADIRHQRPRLDGVYVLLDGDNVRIKRIGRGFDGRIELISDNERYPNETLAGPEAEALRVAGKVVWAGGKI